MIATALTDMFRLLEHPIVLAPMGGVSGGHLAAAVSNAGGLGVVGGAVATADSRWRPHGLAGATPGSVREQLDSKRCEGPISRGRPTVYGDETRLGLLSGSRGHKGTASAPHRLTNEGSNSPTRQPSSR